MRQRDRVSIVVFAAAVLLILYSSIMLFWDGPLTPFLMDRSTFYMAVQLLLFFIWSYGCLRYGKSSRLRVIGILFGIFLFTWCHQIFLPLVVSGIYILYLLGLGRIFRTWLDQKSSPAASTIEMGTVDFLIGSAVWICLVCLMSLIGLGSIAKLRLLVIFTTVLVIAWHVFGGVNLKKTWKDSQFRLPENSLTIVLSVIILMMLMLQVGRMNIALDYDSLHYGFRTPYILNNGGGIYENLGNINLVYTYSKGLEVLVMPLSGTSSYGYVLAFNLWITVGVLLISYDLVKRLSGERCGWITAAALSLIPGIMNMASTAKSDIITLLFQLAFIYFTIIYMHQEERPSRTKYFILAGCSCVMTYMFKPTSLVFSTVVYGLGLCWLLYSRQLFMKLCSLWWLCAIPVFSALFGLWARTWMITGVPVTSVFTSIFALFGFHVKEPFAFASIPANGGSDLLEGMLHLFDRIWKMFTAPVGKDMDHVIIAWGTPTILLLLLVILLIGKNKKDYKSWQDKQTAIYLNWIFFALSVVSVISVYKLWQVDGNYFMLLYAIIVIQAVLCINRWNQPSFLKMLKWIAVPLALFHIAVTSMTNWAGVPGFSPVRFLHAGYYNHLEEARLKKAEEGNEAIWNLLAADPKTRVLAIGEHPQVLDFPCNVQSYYDLTGSGGNVVLVKTLDNFKKFLSYAETEYIYVQAGFMEPGTRVWDIVNYMIEDGSLANIRYESGNMLAHVNLDGRYHPTPKESIREFNLTYIPKEHEQK